MKRPGYVRTISLLLAVITVVGAFAVAPAAAVTTSAAVTEAEEIAAILNAESYANYAARYTQQKKGSATITLDLFDYTLDKTLYDGGTVDYAEYLNATANPVAHPDYHFSFEEATVYKLLNVADSDETVPEALFTPDSGKVSWDVTLTSEQRGMYTIVFEYYPINIADNVATVERALSIDSTVPFAEARTLAFTKNWVYGYTDEHDVLRKEYRTHGSKLFEDAVSDFYHEQDKGGSDLRYIAYQQPEWRTYSCSDVDGFYHGSFEFYFSAGTHTITLEGTRENLALRAIKLVPQTATPSYEEYLAKYEGSPDEAAAGGSITSMQGEFPTNVSDQSVYSYIDHSSAITQPTSPSAQLLNTIGVKGYNTVGQWASYKFTVSKSGWYNLAMRYHQNILEGMFVSRTVKLSGGDYGLEDGTPTVPFSEAYYTRFDYNKDWQVDPIGDGKKQFKFYFEAGTEYTVYFEVGLGSLSSIIDTVQESLHIINNCYLDIIKLTGVSPDKYRDYGFAQIMPDTIRNLLRQSNVLTKVSEQFVELAGVKGSQVATLDQIALLLKKMGSKESEIANNLSNLKSYIGSLGTWLNNCKSQALVVDYVNVQPIDAPMPQKNANFFQSAWYEIRAFFVSFFVDYNSMGVKEDAEVEESIDVWLAYGRDQSLIWRNLIDTSYTPNSNIAVRLKLVVAGSLLPSVLAGQGPDVYIGLDAATVINYAIRGAIQEVQDYPGYIKTYGYDIALTERGENDYTRTYYIGEDTIARSNLASSTDDPEYISPSTYYMNDPEHPSKAYIDSEGNTKTKYEVKDSAVIFNYANTIPISLYGKTYGIPEQSNFPMMFYRLDVLAELGLDIPKTWDDLLSAIPVFQSGNMEVGLTYASAQTIFVYQMGGSQWLYEDDPEYAGAQIGLGTDVALDAFRFCCRFYTDYSFPVVFDAPNRFRTGEMPIVITDYCSMYNTLTVFATEIRGLWSFTSLPGMVNSDGSINNCSMSTLTATIMLYKEDNKQAAAWDYMMWQAGAEAQANYGNQMVALVGPAAKYATANVKALQNLSWTSSEINSIMAQFDNLASIPNYPGSYIIGRYVKFAFLAAVNDGVNPVEEMYSYISTINKELSRKREEFDLKTLDVGEVPPGYGDSTPGGN